MNNVSTEPLQDCNKIPVIVVEKHKEVVSHIREAMVKKKIPMQGLTIIHFDAHPDMCENVNLPADFAHHIEMYDEAYSKNWLLPMAYAGHFDRIVWYQLPWGEPFDCYSSKCTVGKDINTGFIRLDGVESYSHFKQMYRNVKDMTNTKKFSLEIMAFDTMYLEYDLDEVVSEYSDPENKEYLTKLTNKPYILDIDMDFFTFKNPYCSIYDRANMYERVSEIYASCGPFPVYLKKPVNEIYDFMKMSSERVAELKYVMTCFQCNTPIPENTENYDELMELKDAMDSNYPTDDIDWNLIHEAGVTSAEGAIPETHVNTKALHMLLQGFKDFLDNIVNQPPILITIAKYHNLSHMSDNIQISVEDIVSILQNKLKNLEKPQFTYKSEIEMMELMTISE